MVVKFRMDLMYAHLSRHRNGWCDCWIQEGGREPWQHSHAHCCQLRWHHHTWTARCHQSRLLLLHGCGWKTSNWLMTSCGCFILFNAIYAVTLSVEPYPYITYLVCVIFLCLTPVWVILSFRHPESQKLLLSSWEPIITSMVISR